MTAIIDGTGSIGAALGPFLCGRLSGSGQFLKILTNISKNMPTNISSAEDFLVSSYKYSCKYFLCGRLSGSGELEFLQILKQKVLHNGPRLFGLWWLFTCYVSANFRRF